MEDQDQQLLTSWLAVIGMVTMYWSPVERSIDQCVFFCIKDPIKKNQNQLGLMENLNSLINTCPIQSSDLLIS